MNTQLELETFRIAAGNYGFRLLRCGRVKAFCTGYNTRTLARKGLMGLVQGCRELKAVWWTRIKHVANSRAPRVNQGGKRTRSSK